MAHIPNHPFIPFQQSALFQNIASGGGTPLDPVPMNFPTPTPYQWNTDPTQPDPDVPEDGFNMEVFCSLPANAGHPMCNKGVWKNDRDDKDRYLHIPSDEEVAGMTNMEYIQNLMDRGWLKNSPLGYLPSRGGLLELRKGQIPNAIGQLLFGKLQKAKRDKMIAELKRRGIDLTKFNEIKIKDGKADVSEYSTEVDINPLLQLQSGRDMLGQNRDQTFYQEEQKRKSDRMTKKERHKKTMTYDEVKQDAIKSGGTINPHEMTGSNTIQHLDYTTEQKKAGAGKYNRGNLHY